MESRTQQSLHIPHDYKLGTEATNLILFIKQKRYANEMPGLTITSLDHYNYEALLKNLPIIDRLMLRVFLDDRVNRDGLFSRNAVKNYQIPLAVLTIVATAIHPIIGGIYSYVTATIAVEDQKAYQQELKKRSKDMLDQLNKLFPEDKDIQLVVDSDPNKEQEKIKTDEPEGVADNFLSNDNEELNEEDYIENPEERSTNHPQSWYTYLNPLSYSNPFRQFSNKKPTGTLEMTEKSSSITLTRRSED